MPDRTIHARLKLEIADYMTGLRTAAGATTKFARDISGAGKAASADVEKVGRSALLMAGGLAVGLGLSAKAAMDWEAAWAGVTKTVEGTEAQLAGLEEGLRSMATSLPASHAEIAAVAEAAGALGIATPNVESFTKVMIDLGETTDLTADQAANAFARIANIMETPQDQFEEMGSTVVDLGNNLAATEAEITEMALRIAGAGKQVGLAESEVLGFAGALSSVGLEAEAGGSAISRVFVEIDMAVRDGGDKLATFAETAGMSAQEFAAAYRDDAAGAIVTFIEGLGAMSDAGGNVFGVLGELELNEIRVRDALLRAAGAGDLFREALELGADAWAENSALADEAAKRYETTAAQLEVLKNQVVDAAIEFGETLLPAIRAVAGLLGDFATGLGNLPGPLMAVAAGVAVAATGLLGMVGVLGTLGPKIQLAKAALEAMGGLGPVIARNLGKMTAALGIAAVAVGAAILVANQFAERAKAAQKETDEWTEALNNLADGLHRSAKALLTSELEQFTDELNSIGVSFADVTEAVTGTSDAYSAFGVEVLDAVGASDELQAAIAIEREQFLETSAAKLNAVIASEELTEAEFAAAAAAGQSAEAQAALAVILEDGVITYDELEGSGIDVAAMLLSIAGESGAAIGPVEGMTEELSTQEQTAVDLEEALKEYQDRLAGLFDPLTNAANAVNANREAQIEYQAAVLGVSDAQTALTDAINEYGRESPEAADAARDLMDAQLALDDAQRETIDSALEVDLAMQEMATAIAANPALLEQSIAKLDEWVASGLITEDQALAARDAFAQQAWAAAQIPRSIATEVTANITAAQRKLNALALQLSALAATGVIVQPPPGARVNLAIGGLVPGAGNSDTVPAMLTPGEFVVTKAAVQAVGIDFLADINRGTLQGSGGGWNDRGIIDAITATGRRGGDYVANFNGPMYGTEVATKVERGMRRVKMTARGR